MWDPINYRPRLRHRTVRETGSSQRETKEAPMVDNFRRLPAFSVEHGEKEKYCISPKLFLRPE